MKMSKKIRTLVSTALISAMVLTMGGMSAFADNTSVTGSSTAVTIDKYLVMDKDANVPNATFSYTITAGTAVPAKENIPEVKAGIGTVTISATAFAAGDTTSTESNSIVTLATDQKYAKTEAIVDFSSVTFEEPGIYRYKITENDTTEPGITKDYNTLYLDVYVTSDDDGKLAIDKYVLHKTDEIADKDGKYTKADEKTTGFVNTYATKDLTLEKQVTGNQGNRNKAFNFTVGITNADPSTKYTMVASPSELLKGKDTLTADESGKVSTAISLKDDQSLTILGLTAGTQFVITEEDYSKEGYTTTNTHGDGLTTDVETMGEEDNKVVFTNNREVTTPTGIVMTFGPYILLIALAGVFATLFFRKRREEF